MKLKFILQNECYYTSFVEYGLSGWDLFLYLDPDPLQRNPVCKSWFSTGSGLEPLHIIYRFYWSSLQSGTVVDVGGSQGCVSIAIAREVPLTDCMVQEEPDVINVGQARSCPEMKHCVT